MVRTLAKIPALSLLIFLFTLALLSCTKKDSGEKEANQSAGEPSELKIFSWSEYFDDEFLRAFSEKHNVKVKADYFSSNEEMLAKLQLLGDGNGYDLILPSDYMVRTLIELKMLQALDKSKITVLADFEAESLNPEYDPGLTFTVPLSFGTTGIAVNTKLMPQFKDPQSLTNGLAWKDVMENPAYKGKVTLLDDTREVLQLALLIHGKNIGNATEADVKTAFAYLKKHKAQIKGFPSETRPTIEADECGLCMAYSGDALSVAKEKKEVRFTLPREGATLWTDNLALPANGKNQAAAYLFINELLTPQGARSFTERTGYRTASKSAKTALAKDITGNAVIYPTAAERKRMHYLVQRKDLAALIDREWALLKSQ